jgi:hypothetical protein
VEPYQITVPPGLVASVDQMVERVSRRTGERPASVRRGVEIAIVTRGLVALVNEEGAR